MPNSIGSVDFVFLGIILLSIFLMCIHVSHASATILEIQVSSSSDDAEEQPTSKLLSASDDLELVHVTKGDYDNTVGIRFGGVDIPQGAAIVNAYIQFEVFEPSSTTISLSIEGEASGDAPTLVKTLYKVSSRTSTSAQVVWSLPARIALGDAGLDQRTSDISSVI